MWGKRECADIGRLLWDYAEGRLTEAAWERVERHLQGCRDCRELAEDYRRTARHLAAYREQPVSSLPSAWSELRQSLVAGRQPVAEPRDRRRLPALAWGSVALAGLILAGVALLRPHSSTGRAFDYGSELSSGQMTSGHGVGSVPDRAITSRLANSGRPYDGTATASLVGSLHFGRSSAGLRAWEPPARVASVASHPSRLVKDDLAYMNEGDAAYLRRWTRLPVDAITALEVRLERTARRGDDFISIPLTRLASCDKREIPAAIRAYQQQAAIVDPRLARKVTLAQKATALSDLCQQLRQQTGIKLYANQSVADDKITVFCKDKPLRDLMRQITHVFGFKWLRTDDNNEDNPDTFVYYLTQDLRAQLTEEELRQHDRNEALLAVDEEMQKYRKYLNLSPDDAKAMAQNAVGDDKQILNNLAGPSWGAAHLYFGLSPDQMAALRNGEDLSFSPSPQAGQLSLPPDVASSVLQSLGDIRIKATGSLDGPGYSTLMLGPASRVPDGVPPSSFPGAQANAQLSLQGSELGQFSLEGSGGLSLPTASMSNGSTLAVGVSPSVRNPNNAQGNADQSHDPALQPTVSVTPKSSCTLEPDPASGQEGTAPQPRVTTADVLEALHEAAGMDIVSDYYTRLYSPEEVTVQKARLFDALNRLADTMHDRWHKEDGWLQFRSASYYNDRLKEVPNRLLARWAADRQKQKIMPFEDLMEVAGLSDAQLDARAMAEGARACYGLKEWELARSSQVRAHWRFVAALPSGLRQAAVSEAGLAFEQLPLGLQPQFADLAVGMDGRRRQGMAGRSGGAGGAGASVGLQDLIGAKLHVAYTTASSGQLFPLPDPPASDAGAPPRPGLQEDVRRIEQRNQGDGRAPNATNRRAEKPHLDIFFIYLYGGPHTGSYSRREVQSHGMNSSSRSSDRDTVR